MLSDKTIETILRLLFRHVVKYILRLIWDTSLDVNQSYLSHILTEDIWSLIHVKSFIWRSLRLKNYRFFLWYDLWEFHFNFNLTILVWYPLQFWKLFACSYVWVNIISASNNLRFNGQKVLINEYLMTAILRTSHGIRDKKTEP